MAEISTDTVVYEPCREPHIVLLSADRIPRFKPSTADVIPNITPDMYRRKLFDGGRDDARLVHNAFVIAFHVQFSFGFGTFKQIQMEIHFHSMDVDVVELIKALKNDQEYLSRWTNYVEYHVLVKEVVGLTTHDHVLICKAAD